MFHGPLVRYVTPPGGSPSTMEAIPWGGGGPCGTTCCCSICNCCCICCSWLLRWAMKSLCCFCRWPYFCWVVADIWATVAPCSLSRFVWKYMTIYMYQILVFWEFFGYFFFFVFLYFFLGGGGLIQHQSPEMILI